ncbi:MULTISPECIES: hypothetical protein [unclassified Pseudomonas]|uniref:hypothetical protein n=1 Tax=unclassified Pseudomonas TaxID=196821 RepID=UPI00244A6746|nr:MULTISPECIES: hypothetical protein [unclassified Pseudomonas]MDG9930372.1 hypothetical protein [Pseudomonas sp. GD04042]MDH0484515.1 hypothetical protein [Pseudomonas sp. GD04015]MDH0606027.1 hypothetical protein [Pseudomonas sp. GD03869]
MEKASYISAGNRKKTGSHNGEAILIKLAMMVLASGYRVMSVSRWAAGNWLMFSLHETSNTLREGRRLHAPTPTAKRLSRLVEWFSYDVQLLGDERGTYQHREAGGTVKFESYEAGRLNV